MKFAPIILFVYNRVDHVKKTVEALLKNKESSQSNLIVYSDGPKGPDSAPDIMNIREYIRQLSGFKSVKIIERETNWGLARNLIDGITSVIERYGRAIIMEDDIVTSSYFLQFMNESLERYKDDDRVASIQGYTYPVDVELPEAFFIRCQGCWGWATWERAWKLFNPDSGYLYDEIKRRNLAREFNVDDTYYYMKMLREQRDGKINSWAIRWYASVFLNNKLVLYPGKSLVFNCGFDGNGGTHCTTENHQFDTSIKDKPIDWSVVGDTAESIEARNAYQTFLKKTVLGKRRMIGRFLHHLNLDGLMVGPMRNCKWED